MWASFNGSFHQYMAMVLGWICQIWLNLLLLNLLLLNVFLFCQCSHFEGAVKRYAVHSLVCGLPSFITLT